VRSIQDAEDITQEAFYRFAKNISNLNPKSPAIYNGWLVTTVDNLCIDYYRKKEKTKLTFSLDDEREKSELVQSLLDATCYKEYSENELVKERNALLFEALAILMPFHRNLLVFHYLIGYQVNEVVAKTQITRRDYHSNKSRSFKLMRSYIVSEDQH